MSMVSLYFVIGIIIFTMTTVSIFIKTKDKTRFKEMAWWVATVICVALWPLILLWAIIDIIGLNID